MNFGNTAIMQLSKAKMQYLSQREAVLATNIANADTPGYIAKDLKEPNFAAVLKGESMNKGSMLRTNAMHMQPARQSGAFEVAERPEFLEQKPDGNRVNLDEEVQQVSFTQTEYNKVISIYRKNLGFFKMALGQGVG